MNEQPYFEIQGKRYQVYGWTEKSEFAKIDENRICVGVFDILYRKYPQLIVYDGNGRFHDLFTKERLEKQPLCVFPLPDIGNELLVEINNK